MGIHGLLRELRPAPRTSLALLSSNHYTTHSQPLRLAIDISIWLFQIQSGKGGSNPALRTFYYRLLRLLTLNVHPLFVFDGPNKPVFKRNKKVGGPGVKVASVPEFLAKQLLKQFGFPWHVAPGEAEAECAVLQREGLVDAVLSEDVDTLMFGCGVTLRSWNAEGAAGNAGGRGAKGNGPPTHVSVYREEETRERSGGIDPPGMVLVALMSGGDYLPEGIPGCGPKVACDAARAGFGTELCGLGRKDREGLARWRERLEREIRTNESKFFSRRNPSFTLPEGFPNKEVLGYYTHPCVSSPEKLERLRRTLKWDQEIDFPALREFAKDAFDWRCITGARKFIKNLAPAMLVRELRLRGEKAENEHPEHPDHEEYQKETEETLVKAIHGTRTHPSVDSALELRISFVPSSLVSLDLSLEEEDDEILPPSASQTPADDNNETPSPTSDSESESVAPPPPTSPTKKRTFKPYDPDLPEKVWILKPFLQLGCPLLVEDWEASSRDPKAFLKQRRKAREVGVGKGKGKGIGRGKKEGGGTGMEEGNAVMDSFFAVSKTREAEDWGDSSISSKEQGKETRKAAAASPRRNPLAELSRTEVSRQGNSRSISPLPQHLPTTGSAAADSPAKRGKGSIDDEELRILSPFAFQSKSTVRPSIEQITSEHEVEILDLRGDTNRTHPPSNPSAQSKTHLYPAPDAFTTAFPAPSLPNPDHAERTKPPPTFQPQPSTKPSRQSTRAPPSGPQTTKPRCTPEIRNRSTPSLQPSPARSQRCIVDYYSPSPRRKVPSNSVAGGGTSHRGVARPDFGSRTAGVGDREGEEETGGKVVVDLLSSSPLAAVSAPCREGDGTVEGGSSKYTTERFRFQINTAAAAASCSDEAEDVEMRDAVGSPTPRRRRVHRRESRSRTARLDSDFSSYPTHADEETSLRRKFVRCSGPFSEEQEEQTDVTPRPSRRVGGEVEDGGDEDGDIAFSPGKLPDTVTKRRKKGPRKKQSDKDQEVRDVVQRGVGETVEVLDLAGSLLTMGRDGSARTSGHREDEEVEEEDLPSPSSFLPKPSRQEILRKEAGAVDQMDGVHEDEPSSSYPTPPPAEDEEDREEPPLRNSAGIGLLTADIQSRFPDQNDLPTTRPTKRSQPSSKTSGTTSYPNPSVRRSPRHHQQDPTTSLTTNRQPSLPSLQITKPSSTNTTTTTTEPSHTATLNPPPIKKKAFQLRASLEGSWKEIDLTGDGSGMELSKRTFGGGGSISTVGANRNGCAGEEERMGKRKGKGKEGKWWRTSGVEVLDLTGD
ncbi:hypothetical protein KC318_g8741 [Hortaea werneckii]|uniref:XPG-I domain-containing protein n=1 Tax=Hortaea werneckii TaxID=91943 RepID=A0A3M7ADA6_HORWE|nr:hypothetical protein KC334_g8795 [Hortaea werneckii]KAI7662668.1 hypothetical protein KC318_g8741 [Hortaea werneckii]RMY25441.1 hypothetical protein D0867_00716 [Hortaea werneckii]RMY38049.1 hypothetical protein D0866_02861 [Hortaea werneckii]